MYYSLHYGDAFCRFAFVGCVLKRAMFAHSHNEDVDSPYCTAEYSTVFRYSQIKLTF